METQRFKPAQNNTDLKDFIGTEYYYSDDTFLNFFYTDGVHHLEQTRGCHWLLKLIQIKIKNSPVLSLEHFLTIELSKDSENPVLMHLTITDGNDKLLDHDYLLNQKFSGDGVCLFFTNNVLMLPSEY